MFLRQRDLLILPVYPTSNSRWIMSSTSNGRGLFFGADSLWNPLLEADPGLKGLLLERMVCVAGISRGAGEGFGGGTLSDCGEGVTYDGSDNSVLDVGCGVPFPESAPSASDTLMTGGAPADVPLTGGGWSMPFVSPAASGPVARDRLGCGVLGASPSGAAASGETESLSFSLSFAPFLVFLDGCWPIGGVPGGCGDAGRPLDSLLVKTERSVGASVATVNDGGEKER